MRKCVNCGSHKDMTKVLDKRFNIVSTRHRICFKCQYTLDYAKTGDTKGGSRCLGADNGELNYIIDDTTDLDCNESESA